MRYVAYKTLILLAISLIGCAKDGAGEAEPNGVWTDIDSTCEAVGYLNPNTYYARLVGQDIGLYVGQSDCQNMTNAVATLNASTSYDDTLHTYSFGHYHNQTIIIVTDD
jgi:hypothetical protein